MKVALKPRARNTLVLIALVAGTWLAVDKLADSTQTRPDEVVPGSQTEIVFSVETKGYRQSALTAAQTLWGSCAATVSNELVSGIDDLGDGTFALVVEPSIGDHGKERVLGCLRDLTIDRVRAQLVSVTDS